MPIFRELDPATALAAIEGYDNVLAPAQRAEEVFYRQMACPQCGSGECQKTFVSPQHAFGGDSLLPRYALRCTRCECLFDPHANSLVVEMGKR